MPKKASRDFPFNRVNWNATGRTEKNAEKARNKAEQKILSRMNWNEIVLNAPPKRSSTPKHSSTPKYSNTPKRSSTPKKSPSKRNPSPIPSYRFGPTSMKNAYFKLTKKAHKH